MTRFFVLFIAALVVGSVVVWLSFDTWSAVGLPGVPLTNRSGAAIATVLITPGVFVSTLVFGATARRRRRATPDGETRLAVFDGETHCRRCQFILRGLSEPRCPECGEAL